MVDFKVSTTLVEMVITYISFFRLVNPTGWWLSHFVKVYVLLVLQITSTTITMEQINMISSVGLFVVTTEVALREEWNSGGKNILIEVTGETLCIYQTTICLLLHYMRWWQDNHITTLRNIKKILNRNPLLCEDHTLFWQNVLARYNINKITIHKKQ